MKIRILRFFILFVLPFLMTLCVISYMAYTFGFILYTERVPALYCGRSLTDPLVQSLNRFVPLGCLVHVVAVVLCVFRFKEGRIYALLQFCVFIAVSVLSVLLGECIFTLWFPRFTLEESVWWLF